MLVRELRVHGVRNYDLFTAELHPGVTLILGKNGSGKTTLLESLYFLYRGTSFRGRDQDMIGHGNERATIKAIGTETLTRQATLHQTSPSKVTKEFQIEGERSLRLPAAQKLPVVLFEPDELRLITSSPQRRRDFLDGIISRLSPAYSTLINRYNRTLLQRNELLKQFDTMPHDIWESHLFAWDVKFAELAAKIVELRTKFIERSNASLSGLYSTLADTPHTVEVRYQSFLSVETTADYQQRLFALLQNTHQGDALRGYSTSGPHRDDFTISLDEHPAAETASRGEMRSIMLAYKLLEVELQNIQSKHAPLILMDDVFSELDITRETSLMHALEPYQTIITATDLRDELKISASIIQLTEPQKP